MILAHSIPTPPTVRLSASWTVRHPKLWQRSRVDVLIAMKLNKSFCPLSWMRNKCFICFEEMACEKRLHYSWLAIYTIYRWMHRICIHTYMHADMFTMVHRTHVVHVWKTTCHFCMRRCCGLPMQKTSIRHTGPSPSAFKVLAGELMVMPFHPEPEA